MSDSFDDAVAGVQSPTRSSGSPAIAEAVYEKRKYPPCPEGNFIAICVKTELKEVPMTAQFDAGAMKIHHTWEIQSDRDGKPVDYEDPQDPDKRWKYRVFGKPMSISFGDRATLCKLFKELTGIPPLTDVAVEMRTFEGAPRPKEVKVVRFDQTLLENMVCELKIAHEIYKNKYGEDTTGVSIKSYDCTMAARKRNYDTLPPHPMKVPFPGEAAVSSPVPPAQPVAQQAPAQDIAFGAPAPSPSSFGRPTVNP